MDSTRRQLAEILTDNVAEMLHGKRTLREARGISDESFDGLYELAHGMYEQGKYEEAAQAFELLCFYDHEQAKFWCGLGYCRQQLKDYLGAASALSYADIYRDEPDPEMYLNLSICFMCLGDKESANTCVDEVLRTAPALKERAESVQALIKEINHSDESIPADAD